MGESDGAVRRVHAQERRSHFPNPQLGKPPAGNGIDPSAPLVQSAFKVCQSLEPKVGPRIGF